MKRIALVVTYFGKFPSYFDYWLKCAYNNATIDFYIYTDNKSLLSKNNVFVIKVSFQEIKEAFQKCFEYNISLESPYKLCDYKPLYGKLLGQKLSEYDYWGYIDTDIIFGNIRRFIKNDLETEKDRIGISGHFSIMKTNNEMVNMYARVFEYKEVYKPSEVYQNKHIFAYDEYGGGRFRYGMSYAEIKAGLLISDLSNKIADIDIRKKNFNSSRNGIYHENEIYKYQRGNLFVISQVDSSYNCEEIMYAHFQKRNMELKIEDADSYYIIPNEFVEEYDYKEMYKLIPNIWKNKKYWFDIRKKIWFNRIKNGSLIWMIKDNILKIFFGLI